jgi:hypothetical protein
MDGRTWRIDRQPAYYPPLEACDLIAERSQRRPKQHILFEAVPTPSADNHFFLKCSYIELRWMPKHDVEGFIWD